MPNITALISGGQTIERNGHTFDLSTTVRAEEWAYRATPGQRCVGTSSEYTYEADAESSLTGYMRTVDDRWNFSGFTAERAHRIGGYVYPGIYPAPRLRDARGRFLPTPRVESDEERFTRLMSGVSFPSQLDALIAQVGLGGVIENRDGTPYLVSVNSDSVILRYLEDPADVTSVYGSGYSLGRFPHTGWRLPLERHHRDRAIELAGMGGVVERQGRRYLVAYNGADDLVLVELTYNVGEEFAPRRLSYDSWVISPDQDHPSRAELELERYRRHYIRECGSCGEDVDISDVYDYRDCCGSYYCDNCDGCDCEDEAHGDDYESEYGVHAWNYRPSYVPKGDASQVMMGVELEVGGSRRNISNAVREVDERESHLYMKDDGSIDGVEIVTHPMTLSWGKTFGFSPMLEGLRDAGCGVNNGYGLHVHVSRASFRRLGKKSAPHQMSWLMFLYRNTDKLQLLARREDSRWASFRKPNTGELRRKAIMAPFSDDRYVAVNCSNRATYELRFFKSTLDDQEFFAAMEFADASVEYTRGIKTADILNGDGLTWSHFAFWVASQGDRYSHLTAELVDMEERGTERLTEQRSSHCYS